MSGDREWAMGQPMTFNLDTLGPQDRVGLVTFPAPGLSLEPGPDLQAVRKALSKVVGRSRLRVGRVSVSEALAYGRNFEIYHDGKLGADRRGINARAAIADGRLVRDYAEHGNARQKIS